MLDLRKLTTKEFSQIVEIDFETMSDLMRDCSHLGYTNTPYAHIMKKVSNANIKEIAMEIVAKFIYTSVCNRPEHRFYNGRGYALELRA